MLRVRDRHLRRTYARDGGVELVEERFGNARGNLVSDAFLAAIAIEMGAELVTADRGFGRWPGLKWRHPLDK